MLKYSYDQKTSTALQLNEQLMCYLIKKKEHVKGEFQ